MLVAVYVRMSTDKQESSIERQLSQINRHVKEKGYTVYKIYQDLALKGHDWERPAFIELMADAQLGLFKGIVVDEESRFSRHKALPFMAYIAAPLSELGVWLESVNEGRQDWDDMAGLIMTTIRAEKSNSESSNLGRRVLAKWNMRAEQGKCFLGRPPYGYKYEVDEKGIRTGMVPDETEGGDSSEPARIVRWLFDTYLNTDTSFRALAKELIARAIPSAQGGRWAAATVNNFLRDRVYCGDYRFNRRHLGKFYRRIAGGEVVKTTKKNKEGANSSCIKNAVKDWVVLPDTHVPLIGRDAFMKAQARIQGNATRKASPTELHNYPCLRLLVCSHCGAYMTATKKPHGNRYICGSSVNFQTCSCYGVNESEIMKILVETLEAKFLDPVHLAQLEKEAKSLAAEMKANHKTANHKTSIAKLDAAIANAEANLALVPQKRVQVILDQIADWEVEKAKLEQAMVESGISPTEDIEQMIRHIKEFLWEWRESLLRGDMASTYHLLRQVISKVELRFETRQCAVRAQHRLVGGQVYFITGKPVQFDGAHNQKARKSRGFTRPQTTNYG